MKKTCFLMVLCAATMMLSAQDYNHHRDRDRNQPPDVVIRSYHKEFKSYGNPTRDMQNNEWHTRYMDRQNDNRKLTFITTSTEEGSKREENGTR
jgi:hypothetical protein